MDPGRILNVMGTQLENLPYCLPLMSASQKVQQVTNALSILCDLELKQILYIRILFR